MISSTQNGAAQSGGAMDEKPEGTQPTQPGCLTSMFRLAIGALLGSVIGYFVGVFLACFWLMPNSNLCGLFGVFTGLVGLVVGALVVVLRDITQE